MKWGKEKTKGDLNPPSIQMRKVRSRGIKKKIDKHPALVMTHREYCKFSDVLHRVFCFTRVYDRTQGLNAS